MKLIVTIFVILLILSFSIHIFEEIVNLKDYTIWAVIYFNFGVWFSAIYDKIHNSIYKGKGNETYKKV